ncbi:hypothetical protein [Chroococcidiopsis sp. CCNUC1]|nr:hypothetical protein [Chroococcidiopsis sp. CCNUC1]
MRKGERGDNYDDRFALRVAVAVVLPKLEPQNRFFQLELLPLTD